MFISYQFPPLLFFSLWTLSAWVKWSLYIKIVGYWFKVVPFPTFNLGPFRIWRNHRSSPYLFYLSQRYFVIWVLEKWPLRLIGGLGFKFYWLGTWYTFFEFNSFPVDSWTLTANCESFCCIIEYVIVQKTCSGISNWHQLIFW